MSARSHKIRVGQVEIYAEDTGQGSPALVFLHYWGGSRRTWSGVVSNFPTDFDALRWTCAAGENLTAITRTTTFSPRPTTSKESSRS